MDDTAKYLIHAAITADGVVERSDVVGAIFGQTEGLLGDDLDLRDLQQSSKVGRIDVQIKSRNGQSAGEVTIASSLDKVETSILAASLETITRVGPCRSTVEVTNIEDVRAAKRREVVERAKELLTESFDDSVMTSREILDEVREAVRVEDITDYGGYPAGPHVETSDAIIVVEGRADVLTLLRYGIKNAVAVEGTNVPEAVAKLTQDRTVTAFLDGDRGGELILRELAQVGAVDHVAFAPAGRSVEDLARREVVSALRNKVPYETLVGESDIQQAVAATDGSSRPAPEGTADPRTESPGTTDSPSAPTPATETNDESSEADDRDDATESSEDAGSEIDSADARANAAGTAAAGEAGADTAASDADEAAVQSDVAAETEASPPTLRGHLREVIEAETGTARLLDDEFEALSEVEAADAFDAIADAEPVPYAVILDGELTQRVLDVAAQRGVELAVARSEGEYVKKPVSVRALTADRLTGAPGDAG
ncbi:DNA primase DnaG [Halegenticoccus tardaugens]|uniref:DNA primase DnaG n=1 Tax=Halegenticoccus tardaugens TaxID=2071624 RepID=UPI00100BCA57|nr:DNA primase DnaG [Halegenticoccus tardaugens]